MDLAVIIATYNRNDLRLKNCLSTLLYQNTSRNYGVFIVDCNSTDNLPQMLGSLQSDKINYIAIDQPVPNKAHANNVAIQAVEADVICVTDGYCLFQNTLVDVFCEDVTEDSLLIRARRPSYVPEPIWMDPDLGPEDFEAFRQQGAEWLAEQGIAPGSKRKRLFAAKRDRFMEIQGYDERLTFDEDIDIVRRLLMAGNILVDVSDKIAMAYQPATEDREMQPVKGQQQIKDLALHEDFIAHHRRSPIANLNREWGEV